MPHWREITRFSSSQWVLFLSVALLVLFRSAVLTFWPQSYFDSDQAIFGLMAKHLSEARAFPVFMYGQTYILGVEAWLAAPVFLIAGASVAALKLPLLAVNVAIAVLLAWIFTRQVGLRPSLAFVATLFFVLSAPGTTTNFLAVSGGNVEPFLYIILIWLTRYRPNWGGLVLGIGFLQREFTIYGLVALLALEAARGVLFTRDGMVRRLKMFRSAVEVWLVVTWMKQYSSAAGPGTSLQDLYQAAPADNLGELWSRICIDPSSLSAAVWTGLSVHLPQLFGVALQPLLEYGIDSNATQGLPLGGILLVALFGIAIVRIGMTVAGERKWNAEYDVCAYLLLAGALSFAAFTLLRCGVITIMRYELLSVLGASGLAAWYLRVERVKAIAVAWTAMLIVWAAGTTSAHVRLWAEYLAHPPVGAKRMVIRQLEARGIRYAYADYWLAYYITFLTNEQIIVHSTDLSRVATYRDIVDAHRTEAVRISRTPCGGGRELMPGVYLCSP